MASKQNLQGIIQATTDAFQSGVEAGLALANGGEPWNGQRMQRAGETGTTGGQQAQQAQSLHAKRSAAGRKGAQARNAKQQPTAE